MLGGFKCLYILHCKNNERSYKARRIVKCMYLREKDLKIKKIRLELKQQNGATVAKKKEVSFLKELCPSRTLSQGCTL